MHRPFALPLIALMATSTYASAQIYVPPYNPGLELLNDSIRGNLDDETDEEETAPAPPAPPLARTGLIFTPSKTVRQKVVTDMIAQQRKAGTSSGARAEALFAHGDAIDVLDQAIRPAGLRTNNVADAFTVWAVTAWRAVHREEGMPAPNAFVGVKRNVENSLLISGMLAAKSDAQKQEIAESMLLQAVLISAQIDAAAGDAKQLATLASSVARVAASMGLDLPNLDLTADGFTARKHR